VPRGEKRAWPTPSGRLYKHRELELAEGGKLVLRGDGSITQTDAAGETIGKWAATDPEWAGHALRFGLQPQAETIAPHGRRMSDPRPQGG
jgi:hypothetical protein